MKIKEIMTREPKTCSPETNLAAAAALMLDADCGILPVVDPGGKLVGVVTDRDLFVAAATRDVRPSQLNVADVAQKEVFTCSPDDDVMVALAMMKEHRVRRLPVEGFGHTVAGIVSMNDLALAATLKKGLRSEDVVDTLRSICEHHHAVSHVTAA